MLKFSQTSLIAKVEREIKTNSLIEPSDTIIVAVSGGIDSICLLDILDRLKDRIGNFLLVAHFNHCLRGEASEADEQFVANVCKERGLTCLVGRAEDGLDLSSEEKARLARYNFFEKILFERRGAKVALAHHADDFAETLLLRLTRGTGLNGLRSVPLRRENFVRPLLAFSRKEIEKYAAVERLAFRQDETNFDLDISRNLIRHKVLPLLAKLNPRVVPALYRAGRAVEDDYAFLIEIADDFLNKITLKTEPGKISLSAEKWRRLPRSLRRLVLSRAIERLVGLENITYIQLEEAVSVLEKGVGQKHKILPHSLCVALVSGKIIIVRQGTN